MFILSLLGNVVFALVQDPTTAQVENQLEEAIKVLQIENLKKCQMKIEEVKLDNEKKNTMIELYQAKENLAIIEKMKADHKEEIEHIKKAHKQEIKEIKETYSKDGSNDQNRMTTYLITVLQQSNDLMKYLQGMVKSLTVEISKLQKYQKIEKVLTENKETVDWIEGLLKNYNITDTVDTEKTLQTYKSLVEKQSKGMNTMKEILTSRDNSTHGLTYVEEDGLLVEVKTCTCESTRTRTTTTTTTTKATGQFDKVWTDAQCKNIGIESNNGNLQDCLKACQQKKGCTAVNFSPSSAYSCLLRKCSVPVPLPAENYGNYKGYSLASVGPFDKVWSDAQCKNIGIKSTNGNLQDCLKACRQKKGCTAVNFDPSYPQDCVLRKCSVPVPSPVSSYGNWRGYSL